MILADALAKTIVVAMNVLKKAFVLVFIPLFLVCVSLVQIFAYLFVILITTSSGQFDARSSTFSSHGPTVLLTIFYALMMVHGTFLCVLLADYLAGAVTIQHYFVGRKKGACSGFTVRALWWMFAQFGSLALESLCYTFMIWLRPVCEVVVRRNKRLPQNKVFARVVEFCRAYVSYCSLNTTFALALTGNSLRQAAKKYQSFLYEEDEAGSAVAEIQDSYLQMLSYDITVVTMLIKRIIREVSGADIDSDYLWVQAFSFFVDLMVASMVSELTDNIIKASLFCLNYEVGCGGRVLAEPEDFRNLRNIMDDEEVQKKLLGKKKQDARGPAEESDYSYSYYSGDYYSSSYYSSEESGGSGDRVKLD